ncbi:MAG: fatty acid desaturase [Chloroflexi bacterium HGW-Chloroflexi-10]|nr:MAG: fatty acid desaturase [Chloroflexi bacterium HGW-Chloroflexi-10]
MTTVDRDLPTMKILQPILKPYTRSDILKATGQLLNSLVPYVLFYAVMFWSLRFPYWVTLLLSIPAALFMMRTFILFHDCGHNSFFPSHKVNRIVGFFLGVVTFTPSEQWWRTHAIHHATSGNLEKRGVGDVMTWTVSEYREKSKMERLGYRLFRHPLVMFVLGPIWIFIFRNRMATPFVGKRELRFQWLHNLVLASIIVTLGLTVGWKAYLLVQLPIVWIGGFMGIWLFYLQHQYEDVYWANNEDWNYVASALQGASYYKLPRILQWFSGNIGFHHIHHLSPAIPNYQLDHCYYDNEIFQKEVKTITLGQGIRSIGLDLIDESSGKLVRVRDVKL